MRSIIQRIIRENRGNTFIEFAIVAPVFFLFIFGILEFGITILVDSSLSQSLRDTAREAMVRPITNSNQLRGEMRRYMSTFYKDETVVVMCVFPDASAMQALTQDPNSIFTTATSNCISTTNGGTLTADQQFNSILVFAAEHPWGGLTGLMGPFLPPNLYASTAVKSEYLP